MTSTHIPAHGGELKDLLVSAEEAEQLKQDAMHWQSLTLTGRQVNELEFSIIDQLKESDVRKGEAFVIVSDEDLYKFIKIYKPKGWKPGSDIGIVAYNDNPVKEILEDGITTISTNHDEIGKIAAEMILSKKFSRIKSPFKFIKRNSL